MATPDEISTVLENCNALNENILNCEPIALALIKSRGRGRPYGYVFRTDWQKIRESIFLFTKVINRQIKFLRKTVVSPDLIDKQSDIRKIRTACARCLKLNKQRLDQGGIFRCLLRPPENQPRFRLNENGDIIIR